MDNEQEPTETPFIGRFKPGDHLAVRRSFGYKHHGVYVSDDRVIQFGGRILDKHEATICAVSLSEFERGGRTEVVKHGGRWRLLPPLPEAIAPEEIVERAEWLLENYEPGRYHLIGNNCEHMANFCVAGGYTESHQVRAVFGVRAIVGYVVWLYVTCRYEGNMPVRLKLAFVVNTLVGVVMVFLYNRHIRKFWKDIGQKWNARERGEGEG